MTQPPRAGARVGVCNGGPLAPRSGNPFALRSQFIALAIVRNSKVRPRRIGATLSRAGAKQNRGRSCSPVFRIGRAAQPRSRRLQLPGVPPGPTLTDPGRIVRSRRQCCYGVELPEKDDLGGAKVSALLLSAVMRPGTPWVRRVDAKSARLAASSLIVPLRYTSPICGPPLPLIIK